jgi:beta-lactamase superfamily II metal-dependent hydrolase
MLKIQMRIRMYKQGLGDCFLLTFPKTGGGEAHVLIDCGVLQGTGDARQKMRDVAENIKQVTGGQLDVVIVTHEHWDHLAGFAYAQDIFAEMKVREVWVAWTEDPTDKLANKLAGRRAQALKAVEKSARKLADRTETSATRMGTRLTSLLQFYGGLGATGRMTTAGAFRSVKSMVDQPRYCRPDDAPFSIKDVPGVRVYALGPPRDEALLKKSNPSKTNPEVYTLLGASNFHHSFMAAIGAPDGVSENDAQPFSRWFEMRKGEADLSPFLAAHYSAQDSWRRIDHDWMGVAEVLALNLDSDTNNTCLVLAFELTDSGRVLLFPGDAQVGNWLSWQGLSWTVKEGGSQKVVTTNELLARTVLYKVGHHGSHNATLREKGLELMTSPQLASMISVDRETAHRQVPVWKMPFPALLSSLKEKTRGRIMEADLGLIEDTGASLTEAERKQFRSSADVQPGWIDYLIDF